MVQECDAPSHAEDKPDDRAIDALQIQFRDRLSQHKAGLRNLVDKIGELTNAVQELEMPLQR